MTYSKLPADRTRPHKALIVGEFSPATWDQWIRLTSRADDGRDPATSSDLPPTTDDSHNDTTHPRA